MLACLSVGDKTHSFEAGSPGPIMKQSLSHLMTNILFTNVIKQRGSSDEESEIPAGNFCVLHLLLCLKENKFHVAMIYVIKLQKK